MTYKFEIVHINIHHNRGLFIFARHLGNDHKFQIPDRSLLGDLFVDCYIPLQNKLQNEGKLDMFVFIPSRIEDIFDSRFHVGQQVVLSIPE